MTSEREKAINEWLGIHCRLCANNDDRGTNFLNCQAECEVQKDIGIACIHYEEAHDIGHRKVRKYDRQRKSNRDGIYGSVYVKR
jgi:hypothetical protein